MQVHHSVLLHGVKDAQNVQEEVDYIQVQVDWGQYVLLGRQLAHQNVCVVDDEAAEEQSAGAGAHQLHRVVVEENLVYSRRKQSGKRVLLFSSTSVQLDSKFDCMKSVKKHSPS